MSELRKATERASQGELDGISRLANLFERWPLSMEEKIVNLGLFMRRQELSYLLANYEIFKQIQHVKGSLFYFGVYHGAGFMTWANLSAALEPFNHTRELVGFDTFSGYPAIGEKDRSDRVYATLVEGGFYSDSEVLLNERIRLYDEARALNHIRKCSLVRGDVCETLPEYLRTHQHALISAIVLTMNLYEPTRQALACCWPRLAVGGAVVIHSLNEEYYPGATRALLDELGSVAIRTFSYTPNLAYVIKE